MGRKEGQQLYQTEGDYSWDNSLFDQPVFQPIRQIFEELDVFKDNCDPLLRDRAIGRLLQGSRMDSDPRIWSAIRKEKRTSVGLIKEAVDEYLKQEKHLKEYFSKMTGSRQFNVDGTAGAGLTQAKVAPERVMSYEQFASGKKVFSFLGLREILPGLSSRDEVNEATKSRRARSKGTQIFRAKKSQD